MGRLARLAAGTVVGLVLLAGIGTHVGGASATRRWAQAANPFMQACGSQFCIGQSHFYPFGATFYESTPQAGIDNPAGAIALARGQHLNTIRLVDFLDHDDNPYTAPYDPATWTKVDTFIADAQAANVKILLDLSDFRAELWNACIDPYTASWSKYLAFVARRVNGVTGIAYRSDPEIVLVTFAGEPLQPGSHTFVDAAGGTCTISYSAAALTKFYNKVERRWRALDRHHLTAAGGLSYVDQPNSTIDWQHIFGNRANSVCAWKTYGNMMNWLPQGAQYCQNVLHKPWFNDEWGYTQSMGDSARASAFNSQFANNNAHGAAGNFYWNANDLVSPTTYDVGPATPLTQAAVVSNAP